MATRRSSSQPTSSSSGSRNSKWTYRLTPREFELLAARGLVDHGERFRLADPPDCAYVHHETRGRDDELRFSDGERPRVLFVCPDVPTGSTRGEDASMAVKSRS